MTLISKSDFSIGRSGWLVCGLMTALTSCTTSKLDLPDSERFPAPQVTVIDDGGALSSTPGPGLQNTGRYPGFSEPLRAASAQMSDEDATIMQQKLAGLARKRKSGAMSEAEYKSRVEEMRKLAAEHGTDTLTEIQN